MIYTSKRLTAGQVYTRADLKMQFEISDATLNTGVFRPAKTNSIWLFITEKKSADRTPYDDFLEEGTLQWQGQMKGRTDNLIIDHEKEFLEILVFYRRRKYEYMGAGFRFEGNFKYQSHTGNLPKSFLLKKLSTDNIINVVQDQFEKTGEFNPLSIEDGQVKILTSIVRRRGQAKFRAELTNAYSGRCALTGCRVQDVLEAAHIVPYMGRSTNHIQNGLLLRSDIHTLFDLQLIMINPENYKIILAPELTSSEYSFLEGKFIQLPTLVHLWPSKDALRIRQSRKTI